MGRLKQTTTAYSFVSGNPFTIVYGYDAASNRTGMTDPNNGNITYTYDTLNRLTNIQDYNNNNFGFSLACPRGELASRRNALSRRTQMTRPNGINTNYGYDALSNLQSILHQAGVNTLDGATYTYDHAGNRTSKTNLLNSTTSNYTYDNIYQLTGVTAPNPESYTYDPVGNRLTSQNVSSYTYNSSNELTAAGVATYTYDDNGNALTKTDGGGTTTYNWDFENRLTSVQLPNSSTVNFKYDPFGRRIQKGSSVFAYEGANLIQETSTGGSLTARYVFGAGVDEPLTAYRGTASEFYQADGLGSVTSLSTTAGILSDSFSYDSFGNVLNSMGSFRQPFRYTGREWEPETGLYYYRARYYDPSASRFLGEDPIAFGGGHNFYLYTDNHPLDAVDPSGEAYYLTYSNGKIYVNASITIYGPGATSARAQQWQDAIYNIFNKEHHEYNGCDVIFNIQVISDPSANHFWTAADNPHFLLEGQNHIYVNGPGTAIGSFTFPPLSTGQWDRNQGNFITAHETTHVLWLTDTYDNQHTPLPGFENALTSDQGGDKIRIPQSQIDMLLKGIWPDRNRPTHCDCKK